MMRHLLIRASAGSGKTYQLAIRFLSLLACGTRPESILALTFTRKAAGEFADRILGRLAEASLDEKAAAALGKEIREALEGSRERGRHGLLAGGQLPEVPVTPGGFHPYLKRVTESLDKLSLGTYDSFFTRITKVFALDLGLGGFHLLEAGEEQEERQRLLARILSRLGGKAAEREAFFQAFKLATFGSAEVGVAGPLDRFITSHHQRFLAAPLADAWGGEERLWGGALPWPKVDDPGRLREAVEASIPEAWGKSARTSIEGLLDKLCQGYGQHDWDVGRITSSRPGEALLAPGPGYVFELRGKAYALPEPGAEALRTLWGGVLGVMIRRVLRQTRGIHDLMALYEPAFHQAVRSRGRLGFADLTWVLGAARLGMDGGGQIIGYRLDQWFEHWLLDEFQDTSREQWRVVEGLLQEVQQDDAASRTLFVVGDLKQAVHRWRGADPELLRELADDPGWQARMDTWPMDVSYRSAPPVLDFVNLACDPAAPWMEVLPSATRDRWDFHAHRAAGAAAGLTGGVVVVDLPGEAGTDDSGEPSEWRAVADYLDEVRPLQRGLTCGILVASNDAARELGDFLAARGMAVEVEAEVHAAADSAVGAALLDLCRWLVAPRHALALGHVSMTPLWAALRDLVGAEEASGSSAVWRRARSLVASRGVGALVGGVAQRLDEEGLGAHNRHRLGAWEREASRFDAAGGTLDQFLARMEAWKLREHSQPGALQIMTIHKAKGLEFDLVVLPKLGGKPFDDPGRLGVLERRGAARRLEAVMLAPPSKVRAADAVLAGLEEEWRAAVCEERLALLYVALTRAKRGLMVVLPPSREKQDGTRVEFALTHGAMLREAAASMGGGREVTWAATSYRLAGVLGDADWFRALEVVSGEAVDDSMPVAELSGARPRRRRVRPSGADRDDVRAPRSGPGEALRLGRLVHAWFEGVEWLGDEPPDLPRDPEAAEIIRRVLDDPATRALLTRRGEDVEVQREQPVEQILEDGSWMSGVVDRLEVTRRDGRAVSAVVVDFKTDRQPDLAALREKHRPQIEAYRQAVASALGLGADAVRGVIVATHAAAMVEV